MKGVGCQMRKEGREMLMMEAVVYWLWWWWWWIRIRVEGGSNDGGGGWVWLGLGRVEALWLAG